MCTYVLTETNLSTAETKEYVTFGIRSENADNRCTIHIPDVSTNKQLVRALVERCNAGQLDPVHLHEVVEDAIAEG